MKQTLYWHDYETWGLSAHYSQPAQFAGIRTDLDLNEIGDEVDILCQPLPDYLPDPGAVMVTGLTPQQAKRDGLPEPEFATQVLEQLGKPGTIGVGYNSLRFDDTFSRVLLYRNLYQPYKREYENDNGRWDIIDLVRAMRALRPDGIKWPVDDDDVATNRLELLSAANGLAHEDAHDALSDVRATIGLARLLKQAQPKLYDYAFSLRNKQRVKQIVEPALKSGELLVHSTGMFKSQYCNTSIVKIIGQHPRINNKYFVYDLRYDPTQFTKLSDDQLRTALFGSRDEREELPHLPLKSITINKSPFLAPLNVLDAQAQERIQLSPAQAEEHAKQLDGDFVQRLVALHRDDQFEVDDDPDAQLYAGFINDGDGNELARLRGTEPSQWGALDLSQQRLNRLACRYQARHFPQTLDEQQRGNWQQHIAKRLLARYDQRFMTYDEYARQLKQLADEHDGNSDKQFLLEELQLYGQAIYPAQVDDE